jgi:mannose-6-phosphate isomerase
MNFSFTNETSKESVFTTLKIFLEKERFTISKIDNQRPWGGFFVIDEKQSKPFKKLFFEGVAKNAENSVVKLSPKILVVEAHRRLSWQYHFRRSEIWKLIGGEAGIVRSDDDREGALEKMQKGQIISLKQGERHRLIGLNSWGVIAEIWQHTDYNNPSDEDDIVRVQDDFGR